MKIIGIAVLTLILVFAFTPITSTDSCSAGGIGGMEYENEFDNEEIYFGPYDGNWIIDKIKKIIPGKAKGHDKNKDKGKKVGHDKVKKNEDKGKKLEHNND